MRRNNVFGIREIRDPEEVISILEGMLESAKEGGVRSFAAVMIFEDGCVGSAFSGYYEPIKLLGAVNMIGREIQDNCVDLRLHDAGVRYD